MKNIMDPDLHQNVLEPPHWEQVSTRAIFKMAASAAQPDQNIGSGVDLKLAAPGGSGSATLICIVIWQQVPMVCGVYEVGILSFLWFNNLGTRTITYCMRKL